MQRFYVILLACSLLTTAQLAAQTCTPGDLADTVVVQPLPYTVEAPENGIQDTACVGRPFAYTISVRTPNTVTVPIFGEIPLDSITIEPTGAIDSLPASFSYNCTPGNCTFPADSVGCLLIYGTPTAEDIGTHNLKITLKIWSSGFSTEYTLPDDNLAPGNYFLNVRPANFANCASTPVRELRNDFFSVAIAPNPVSETATVRIESKLSISTELRIFDAVGRLVQRRPVHVQPGENFVEVNAAKLTPGFYVFTLGDGNRAVSGRFSVVR